MKEFFEQYQDQIIYAILVIAGVLFLLFLNNFIYRFLIKTGQKRFPDLRLKTIDLLKKLLNLLWPVLGIIVISFVSFGVSYETFQSNLKLTLYVGFLSILTIVLASSANFWIRRGVHRKESLEEDPTVLKFSRYVVVWGIYLIGIMFILLAFPSLRGVAQTALGGAGIIALIAGVASQEALSNLVGGLFIIFFKPFKIGDVIKTSDSTSGTVVDITLRHTVLRNSQNKMIVIPNAIINKEKLINFNLKELKVCEQIEIGISYDSDIDLAKKIMQEECENHPLILDNRTTIDVLNGKPMVRVAVISLNEYSITIRVWAWARTNPQAFQLRCDVLESIKKRFDAEGVVIPYPHRTITIENQKQEETFPNKSNQ